MADGPVTKKELATLQKQVDALQKSHDELTKWFQDEKKQMNQWFNDEKKYVRDRLEAITKVVDELANGD